MITCSSSVLAKSEINVEDCCSFLTKRSTFLQDLQSSRSVANVSVVIALLQMTVLCTKFVKERNCKLQMEFNEFLWESATYNTGNIVSLFPFNYEIVLAINLSGLFKLLIEILVICQILLNREDIILGAVSCNTQEQVIFFFYYLHGNNRNTIW